jgi:hypothetical protein
MCPTVSPEGEGKHVWAPNLALMLPRAKEIGAETLGQNNHEPLQKCKNLDKD